MALAPLAAVLMLRAAAGQTLRVAYLEEVRPTVTTCLIPCDYGDSLARVVLWNDTIRWNNTARWFAVVKQNAARDAARLAETAPASTEPVSAPFASHDPCAEPISGILPPRIVNRESGGQCGVVNYDGCGGRTCLGWAQVDLGHFQKVSPWGGRGTCYGLSYNACVDRLSAGGTNLGPWGG